MQTFIYVRKIDYFQAIFLDKKYLNVQTCKTWKITFQFNYIFQKANLNSSSSFAFSLKYYKLQRTLMDNFAEQFPIILQRGNKILQQQTLKDRRSYYIYKRLSNVMYKLE